MSFRSEVPSKTRDQLVFKHTADVTKRINVVPSVLRGGTRL